MKLSEVKMPLLAAKDIECRVQSVKENKNNEVGCVVLIYKDARVDMRILDEVFGIGNWQRTHEVIGGNLFCTIEIWDDDKKMWIKKQDVGIESNTEKEKGQASDAFKRAAFNLGIGRELYTAPFTYITLKDNECWKDNNGKWKTTVKFSVTEIEYNKDREITKLLISDRYGKARFYFGDDKKVQSELKKDLSETHFKHLGDNPEQYTKQSQTPEGKLVCSSCGNPITKAIQTFSQRKYGADLCPECQA